MSRELAHDVFYFVGELVSLKEVAWIRERRVERRREALVLVVTS
jgi:hypothetical protein